MAASRQVVIARMGRHISQSEEVIACHVFMGRFVSRSGQEFNNQVQLFQAFMESDRGGHVGVAVTVRRMLFAQQTNGLWEEFSIAFPEVAHVEYEDALTSGTLCVQLKSGVRLSVRGASGARVEVQALHDAMACAVDLTEALGLDAEHKLAVMRPDQLTSQGAMLVISEHRKPLRQGEQAPADLPQIEWRGPDVAEQLLKLGKMRREGLLSDDEFAAMKRQLLGT